jgi:hypothetical protein
LATKGNNAQRCFNGTLDESGMCFILYLKEVDMIASEKIELEIIEYCMNDLSLLFDEFWYEWFPSNKESNCTVHINSNVEVSKEKIQKTFGRLSFVDSLIEIKIISLPEYADFKFQHYIHFRKKL